MGKAIMKGVGTGNNPNSWDLNIGQRGGVINKENAREMQKKSMEARKYNSCGRKCLQALADDKELEEVMKQLLSRGRKGNLSAIRTILEYTDDKSTSVVVDVDENKVKLAFISERLPANKPPVDDDNG